MENYITYTQGKKKTKTLSSDKAIWEQDSEISMRLNIEQSISNGVRELEEDIKFRKMLKELLKNLKLLLQYQGMPNTRVWA